MIASPDPVQPDLQPSAQDVGIVLLHGLGTDAATWDRIEPLLEQHHRVLAIDVPGYAITSPEVEKRVADMFNSHPDRFLFGTDNVAPADQATQLRVYHLWDPVWAQLTPQASLKIRKGNYERIFDAARARVRAWEKANVKPL